MKKLFLFATLLLAVQSSLSAQCLVPFSCPDPPPTFCDSAPNDSGLWNDPAFLDVSTSSSDLNEATTDLTWRVTDTCGTGNVQASFVLLLDLDGDGVQETAVSSAALPGTDTIYFGNAANPNYTGGAAHAFDQRPVPANEKYRFVLEQTVQGQVVTARVRWTTALAPNVYVHPELPYGLHHIEWRFKKDGAMKSCGYDFKVQYCPSVNTTVEACAVYHCDGAPMPNVHFNLTNVYQNFPVANYDLNPSDASGCTPGFNALFPEGSTLGIVPNKDGDPLEGVNTLDLLLISRHILGLEPLDSPYKMIAADANKSGSITSYDIQQLQLLLLGEIPELPNNTAWRFVDSSFAFPNPNNPFQTGPYPGPDTVQPFLHKKFFGVKIGDVDCSALQMFTNVPEEYLSIPDLALQTGDIVDVPIYCLQSESRVGFQAGLQFDPAQVQVLSVIPGQNLGNGAGSMTGSKILTNQVNISWLTSWHTTFPLNKPVYSVRVKALAPLQLADIFRLDTVALHGEAYLEDDSRVRLKLQFATVATTEPGTTEQILEPQPNPTTAGVRLPLQAEESAPVVAEIIDGTGRLLYRREEIVGAGSPSLEIPASAFPQAGVYFWRVQLGKVWKTGKILKQ